MSTPRVKAVVVGLVAVLIAGALAVRVLSAVSWDPTIFAAFGEDATPTREFAEERLGDVYLRANQGHDGKFFFVQAHDPMVLEPSTHALILDRPLYRSQRMLYPLLAGGLGLFSSEVTVWSMLLVNLLAIGGGTYATARVAQQMGGSQWWGLAFALNVGLISEMNIGGAGVLAAALAFGAVASVVQGRQGMAIGLLMLSALAREAFLIAAAGVVWWLWKEGRKRAAVLTALLPVSAVGLWATYLRLRISSDAAATEIEEIGLPFVGFLQAVPAWISQPANLAVGFGMILLFVLFLRRTVTSNALVGWTFLGFIPLALLFTKQVWVNYFDITRAVAPVITAFVLMVFLTEKGDFRRLQAQDAMRHELGSRDESGR